MSQDAELDKPRKIIPEPAAVSKFIHSLISSQLNTKYIQYHCPLAENIVSHAILFEKISLLKSAYLAKFNRSWFEFEQVLNTKYYENNKVFTVITSNKAKIKDYRIVYRNDYQVLDFQDSTRGTLEYVGENQFRLNVDTFPVKKTFHHERQSIVHVLNSLNWKLEIEGLMIGIKHFEDRCKSLNMDKEDDFFSFSFRLTVKNGMTRSELEDHVEILRDIF